MMAGEEDPMFARIDVLHAGTFDKPA